MDDPGASQPLIPIRAHGPDATGFLHDQLTVDLHSGIPDIAGWCDAKGRLRAVFRPSRDGEDWLLALPASLAAPVRDALAIYILRAKLTLTLDAGCAWDALGEIRAGRAQLFPQTADDFLPTLLNLDLTAGLNWRKGCYPGQGVINRAHHLGSVKRRTLRFELPGAVPDPGSEVMHGDRRVGTVLYGAAVGAGCELLAVVNLADAAADLRVGDARLTRLDLPYAIPELA